MNLALDGPPHIAGITVYEDLHTKVSFTDFVAPKFTIQAKRADGEVRTVRDIVKGIGVPPRTRRDSWGNRQFKGA